MLHGKAHGTLGFSMPPLELCFLRLLIRDLRLQTKGYLSPKLRNIPALLSQITRLFAVWNATQGSCSTRQSSSGRFVEEWKYAAFLKPSLWAHLDWLVCNSVHVMRPLTGNMNLDCREILRHDGSSPRRADSVDSRSSKYLQVWKLGRHEPKAGSK